jgi:alkyl hydroperoxide reductase subunit AhpC
MSIDSVFVHKMWNDNELSRMVKGGVPFPMLSDGGGKVGTVYGVYDENAGVETRGRFIKSSIPHSLCCGETLNPLLKRGFGGL